MPYVHRSPNGEVESLHRAATLDAAEFLDAADPAIQRFLTQQAEPNTFGRLDSEFVRVLEDLIDVLLSKGALRITDLPDAVQAKLVVRKEHRERGGSGIANYFSSSGFVEVIDDSAFGQLDTFDYSIKPTTRIE
jgi:hypothetical protein